jgi:hypothetical protein
MSTLAARVYPGLKLVLNADSVELAIKLDSIEAMMGFAGAKITLKRKKLGSNVPPLGAVGYACWNRD